MESLKNVQVTSRKIRNLEPMNEKLDKTNKTNEVAELSLF